MIQSVFSNSYEVLIEAAPYVLFGTIVAGLLRAFMKPEALRRWFEKPTFGSVFRATVVGVPMPLCSCSVLPVAMQLRRSGANRGATSAFLISTPQTGVDSILLSLGMMNPVLAVARVIGATVTGLVAGSLQIVSERLGWAPPEAAAPAKKPCGGCCGGGAKAAPVEAEPGLLQKLLGGQAYAFGDLLPSMSKYYVAGILLSGVVLAFLPEGFLSSYLGGGLLGMLVVCVVGVVMYICASGATPLVAILIWKGMSPGTALVLLLAGPATSLASMVAVRAMLGTRGLLLYLASIIVCAIALGMGLDAFYAATGWPVVVQAAEHIHSHRGVLTHGIAILMGLFFVVYTVKPWLAPLLRQAPPRQAL